LRRWSGARHLSSRFRPKLQKNETIESALRTFEDHRPQIGENDRILDVLHYDGIVMRETAKTRVGKKKTSTTDPQAAKVAEIGLTV
jgi:hypothetical protein